MARLVRYEELIAEAEYALKRGDSEKAVELYATAQIYKRDKDTDPGAATDG